MTVENLFAIQTEIARNVVSALKATLTDDEAARIEKSPTQNLEALQEYMRGQQLLAMRNVEEMREGKARFEHALTLDPEFAPAMVGLANAYHLLYEYTEDTEEETVTPAMALLEKALVIDPELGEAYMVRGELNRHLENWEQAESDFRRALALSPGNAAAHHWFSNLRGQQGFKEESDLLLKKAHELDPMSRIIHVNVAMQPHWGERGAGDQRALDELKRVQNLHPDFYIGYMYEGWIYSNQGKPLDALRAHLKAYEIDPLNNRNGAYCWGYFNLGANDKTLSCVNEIIERHGPSGRAMALKFFATLAAEDEASAVAMLEQAIEAGPDAFYIGIWALALGDIEKATPYFSNAFPNWFSGESVDGADDLNDASSTALILNAQGEFEKAHRLISAALDTLQDRHRNRGGEAFGFDDVALLAQQGRKEEALLALRAVADLEYLSGWQFLRFHPVYDSLREEPRFIAALADLEQAAASARQQAIEEGLF
jgi:tetratricopeptide (TPR) repeat protein